MPINFHDEQNKMTYTTREADQTWIDLLSNTVELAGKQAVDIGCGGGIYSKALMKLGVRHVTAVDFSEEMLKGASENCKDFANISFWKGEAYQTNLPTSHFDIVLERALIHHLHDLAACFKEANRLLKNKGIFIIQDRTPEDCLLPGDDNHLRGYFFEKYPKLVKKEIARRHSSTEVKRTLEHNGFKLLKEINLWETRRTYQNFAELQNDLRLRTGRSILHELTNNELNELIDTIKNKLQTKSTIVEKDRWTIWIAIKQ